MKAKFARAPDEAEEISMPLTGGLMPLARTKLKAMADIMACSEAEASLRILEQTLAGLPDRALPAYLLPSLSIRRCERIGEELVRIALNDGHVFTGHRSNQREFLLHQLLSKHLPAIVDGDAYKLALDIERRYYAVSLPWYFPRGGVYLEGGCFTGMKAIRWADLAKPKRILAVEMGRANFEILRTNIIDNGHESVIHAVHAGLWRHSGEGVQKHDFSTRRFLEHTDDWKDQMRHDESVRLMTVDDLLDENGVEVADYANIQVNGAEIEVLKGIRKTIDRIKVLDIAAYYSVNGTKNADVVETMLRDRDCTILKRTELGRVTAVTPRFRAEILAQERRPSGRFARAGR